MSLQVNGYTTGHYFMVQMRIGVTGASVLSSGKINLGQLPCTSTNQLCNVPIVEARKLEYRCPLITKLKKEGKPA